MDIDVIKAGGSVIGTQKELVNNLELIGKFVKEYAQKSKQCAIIVSALKGRTRELDDNFRILGLDNKTANAAFTLSAGEIESAGYVAAYLTKMGMPAQALNPWNIVFAKVAKNDFRNAKIEKINTQPILECLDRSIIPVIPGYTCITVNGQPATGPYDSSDKSAVDTAVALKANNCIFCKDVPGVYGEDGDWEFDGKLYYSYLTYYKMLRISKEGGTVLHPDAVKLARKNDLPLWVKKIGHPKYTYIR